MRSALTRTTLSQSGCATGATLDAFTKAVGCAEGVCVPSLNRLDCVDVRTRNSLYRVVVLEPAASRVLISGGAFFSVPVEATVAGASMGGSMLKLGEILQGFQLEILQGGLRIVTTPVRHIRLNETSAFPGPF